MDTPERRFLPPTCEIHGKPVRRRSCRRCNAAYMRTYLRGRRVLAPELTIWQRAHRRAAAKSIPFGISVDAIAIPKVCPVLGIPIRLGEQRTDNSPSLDRIIPMKGYVPGNVHVISDKANRLKGDRTLVELREKSLSGAPQFRAEYGLIADYVDRERLLAEIWERLSREENDERWTTISEALQGLQLEAGIAFCGEYHHSELTSAMIESEFCLSKREVLLLRRRAGFPRPVRKRDGFRFDRQAVEKWIAIQPDPHQPASILKLQKAAMKRCRNVRSKFV